MGRQYIDAIWLLPIIVTVFILWVTFRLGIEVGRDQVKKEIRARRRTAQSEEPRSNVIPLVDHQ